MLYIYEEPRGEAYKKLIRFFASISDYFELSKYNFHTQGRYGKDFDLIMSQLDSFLISSKKSSQNQALDQFRARAITLYQYEVNSSTTRVLKNAAEGLFEWGGRDEDQLPEDLTFYQNKIPILVVAGHEEYAMVNLQREKDKKMLRSISGIEISEDA